jgi:hypothetical protein
MHIHFPFVTYEGNDLIIRKRVDVYMRAAGLSPEFEKRYIMVISGAEASNGLSTTHAASKLGLV